jgi:glycosyltransferase involved in cell wall biosynthesis
MDTKNNPEARLQAERQFVSIVMPCLNEARFIEGCVRSAQEQSYPADRLEILVADGGSTDGTRENLARLAQTDPRIRVIDNPHRIQAVGLNRMIREAKGAVIVRMDVHAEYAPDYVEKCVDALESTRADNVGGAQRCAAETRFQEAVCAALRSPLGMGGAAYRDPNREGYVDTVFLGAFRRDLFDRVGLYDERAATNEDAEFNQRIVQSGGRIYLSRDIHVRYFPRETYGALARQYYRYGFGRARTLLKHRRLLSLRPVLPFVALCTGGGLLVVSPRWALMTVVSYGIVTAVEAVRVGRTLSLGGIARVWLVFAALHFSQALGFGIGLLAHAARAAR